ncbi:autotransporter domain-containing protein [Endozoicomonas sp. Mp262]|uniref:autotransporter family protein n=1 Tax=Endozoicomonas sp. Mp262 TaxID=2919499 RepID=UPI0021D8875B
MQKLTELKKSTIAIVVAALSATPAYSADWVVTHPWIFTNPDQVQLADELVESDGDPVLGADGRPLIILYKPKIDSVAAENGNKLILKTNIFSFTSDPAIKVTDGALDGITIDDKSVWSWKGPGSLKDPNRAAIHVGEAGSLTGEILNSGNIKGGIYITSTAMSSNSIYEAAGGSDVLGLEKATLEDGISVINGGIAEAANDHAIKITNDAYVDFVTVGESSRLTAKGAGRSAIYVGAGGQLGGSFSFTHGIDTLRTLAGNEIKPESQENVIPDYSPHLPIDSTGYPRAGDADDLASGQNPNNFLTVDFDNDDNEDNHDGDYIDNNSNGEFDEGDEIKPDLYKIVEYSLPTNISGSVTHEETDTVILAEGTIESELFSAINIEGTLAGKVHIEDRGTLSGAGGGGKDKGAIWNHGTHTGSIVNEGSVTGGIFVSGTQTTSSTNGEAAYRAMGTNSDKATLTGSYSVVEGGSVTAAGNHAVYLDRYSSLDFIEVDGTDSLLKATGSDNAALYIEEDAELGGANAGRADTDSAVIVDNSGMMESTSGPAIQTKGRLLGHILVDNGTIKTTGTTQDAIHIASTGHLGVSSLIGANDPKALVVTNGGTVSGTRYGVNVEGDVYGKIHVDGGTVISSAASNSTIYIAAAGEVNSGTGADVILIENGGKIESTNDSAIEVVGSLSGRIRVNNGSLTANASADAIDFLLANNPLHFIQEGSSASTTGAIRGSVHNDDKVAILGGTFNGQTITDVEDLTISTNASVTLTGDFTIPKETTLQIEEGFDPADPIISVKNLNADDSKLYITAATLGAYTELAANGSTTVIVANRTADGTIQNNIENDISTGIKGHTEGHVSAAGRLLQVDSVAVNGTKLEVTVSALDASAFAHKLLEDSLTETESSLVGGGASIITTGQVADSEKAEALFSSLSSTNDYKQLASQVAQPLDITTRAGLGVMTTTQNITLKKGEGAVNGFSFGDGFNGGELWGQVIYSKSDQATMADTAGYKGKTNGYILGAGWNFTESWRVGVSGAWTKTTLNNDQGRDAKINSYIGSLYSNWSREGWRFDSLLTLGLSKNDTQKYIGSRQVEADYDSTLWGLRLVAGHTFNLGQWDMMPQVELNYGGVGFDKQTYTETGNSGWEQKIKASDYEVMELGGGLVINPSRGLFNNAVRPELSVMGYYDLKSTGSQFESTYLAGGDPFVVAETERDRFRLQSALGLTMDIMASWTLNAAYNLNWSDHYQAHSFSAKARYEF